MRGRCLCGQVEFEVDGSRFKLYQCHCSLCRRQGGSSSNTATIVTAEKFRWLRGSGHISSWVKASGFRSDFCAACGSPLPNPIANARYFWVPAGLLDHGGDLEIVAHLCVASKAAWDSTISRGECHEGVPDLPDFIASLQPGDA